MNKKVIIDNQRHNFGKKDVIGQGGEATIFRLGKKAVKVYHDPDSRKAEKLNKFFHKNFKLPSNVLAPEDLAFNEKGQVIGFTMNKVKKSIEPVAVLANKKFCAANNISTKSIVDFFVEMQQNLFGIHEQKIVVGDLNDRNEVIDPANQRLAWIDVDSWQWGSFPCSVATEAYLTPGLYGVDLTRGPKFKPEHDWFSFTVLLFRSLLKLHPFRAGIHPDFKSLMTRAEKGITVLDSSVEYPKIGLPPEVLTDDILSLLDSYLKRLVKDPFPGNALNELSETLVECSSCSLWYAGTRQKCPGCQQKNAIDMHLKKMVSKSDNEILLSTKGQIIFFKQIGNSLYCLSDNNGTIYLHHKNGDGKVEKKELFRSRAGSQYDIFDHNLVVCPDPYVDTPDLYVLDISGSDPKPLLKATTRSIGGSSAIFSCSDKYLYRLADGMVMRGELFGSGHELLEREVVQALDNQTWFQASPSFKNSEMLFGFYRVFGERRWFLVNVFEKNFEQYEVKLSGLNKGESLIDLSVKFSKDSVLVIRKTRSKGVDHIRLELLDDQGNIKYSDRFKSGEKSEYQNVSGKAFKSGIIAHPTNDGVVFEKLFKDQHQTMSGTNGLVYEKDSLSPVDDGVIAVTDNQVILIKPRK